MIISGTLSSPAQTATSPTTARTAATLSVGQIMTGRVAQVTGNGQGVIRFADGSSFNYTGAMLKAGEQVQIEVLQLAPEITFRLVGSSSGTAGQLAANAEQSLLRGQEVFSQLIAQVKADQVQVGGRESSLAASVFKMGLQSPLLLSGKGENMAAVLQRVLPNVSSSALMKGDASGVAQLLQGGRTELADAIRLLREAADGLRPTDGSRPTPEAAAELNAARTALQRLGDMLAMQDILPRATPPTGSEAFLGYRLFWLTEGGLGEAVWRREKARQEAGNQPEDITSVLVTLNMTNLGSVQARIAYGEQSLLISIGAEEEEALTALRSQVGELRGALIKAELPLRSLELSRLSGGEIKDERMKALGLSTPGFDVEA